MTRDLFAAIARHLQRVTPDEERLDRYAPAVEKASDAVSLAAGELPIAAEPSHFVRILHAERWQED
jgi:hypothetical protein